MKAILMAGGSGQRLLPTTAAVNKHLLPVYDKPLIYYPLSSIMLAGIKDVLFITRPEDHHLYKSLLGDGRAFGMSFEYSKQDRAAGIAEAFIIGSDFIAGDNVMLALGDNIFFGHGFQETLRIAQRDLNGAAIFCSEVAQPERFGVPIFDASGQVLDLVEKPLRAPSNFAIAGLYFYSPDVIRYALDLVPSSRGELEITDVNRRYLASGRLNCYRLERETVWLDTGTPDAMLDAANFVATLERLQGMKMACLEEIAWRNGWIGIDELVNAASFAGNGTYGVYLKDLTRREADRARATVAGIQTRIAS